ncbi:MAG: hypothetical protein ACRCTE_01965 [Cellulosilyticaceae bacterium]
MLLIAKTIKGQQIDLSDEAIAERLYEESIGDVRRKLEMELLKLDNALNTQDKKKNR